MGALFWRSKQPKTETCLSKGTGSAFEDGGLRGNGLKAVLATAVVFGRACGAASTTLPNEKTIEKTWNKSRKWFLKSGSGKKSQWNPTSNHDSETTPNKLLKPLQKLPQIAPK